VLDWLGRVLRVPIRARLPWRGDAVAGRPAAVRGHGPCGARRPGDASRSGRPSPGLRRRGIVSPRRRATIPVWFGL